jgi:TetR/AcrR family transcriptional regulator
MPRRGNALPQRRTLTVEAPPVYRAVHPMRTTTASAPVAVDDGDAVRRRILAAAQEVFADRGYAGATTREIAARAGIGKRMLFYYYASKDAVYAAALEGIVAGMVRIHERFRDDPGPVGLGEAIEGITHFAARNLPALKLLTREIMDGGHHLPGLVREHLRPLFARGSAEVVRSMEAGVFRRTDPMHVLVNVGGLTLYYFLIVPLLERVWDRDPLAAATVAERAGVVRDFVLRGLGVPAAEVAG